MPAILTAARARQGDWANKGALVRNGSQDLPQKALRPTLLADRVRVARARAWLSVAAVLFIVGALTVLTPTSLAAQSRPYAGTSFGQDGTAGAEPFQGVASIAVDQPSGDVYVYDFRAGRIYKFNSAGVPVDFTSTGTNSFPIERSEFSAQIAVAPAGSIGETEGDIYFAAFGGEGEPAVTVYGPGGARIGAFGPEIANGHDASGVATDASGHVFVSVGSGIYEYAPSANPPVESDFVQSGTNPYTGELSDLALDEAGNLFYARNVSSPLTYKFDSLTDPEPSRLNFSAQRVAVNPDTGIVFADEEEEVAEYAAGGSPKLATFGAAQISGSAGVGVDAATNQVYVSDGGTGKIKVFGSPVTVPTVTVAENSFPTPTQAVVTGSVDPEGAAIAECFVEYGPEKGNYQQSSPCASLPPTGSGPYPVSAHLTGLEPDGVTYHYRLAAGNASGIGRTADQTFTTASTVQTGAAQAVTETTATVTGRLFPDGNQYSECDFEYGPVSESGYQSTVECSPKPGEIPPNFAFHGVTADLTGLQANDVVYRVRLKATTAKGTIFGETLTFTTSGEPLITEVRAADAGQHSATLEATIAPSGFETAYKIEWGASASYGNIASSGSLPSGEGPTRISAPISGLGVGAIYHYRVVASNSSAQTTSLDREVETLDDCALPQGRCFELASEREPGPVASPKGRGSEYVNAELSYQAAERPGALAYESENGYPGATRGGEILYRATRAPTGWSSVQLAPAITRTDETANENSDTSRTLALSQELSCGVVETSQPVPGTTGRMYEVLESGGDNLYRLNEDGSYTPITTLPPENLGPANFDERQTLGGKGFFHFAGMARDCSRIFFATIYRYPGTHAVGEGPLYEWSDGILRAVGSIPSTGGESSVQAFPGNDERYEGARADRDAVSRDGARIFFTARRIVGNDPGEIGASGLFVREGGTSTRDVSQSETSVPDTEPRYQWATPDGSQVFFTAPAGLTPESNPEGTDLYEYDLSKSPSDHPLRDLSVNDLGSAAEVAGMVGASDDGTRVYFAASARMIAGEGLSEQENLSDGSYSLYLLDSGHLRFVATVVDRGRGGGGLRETSLLLNNSTSTSSQVSADGRYLAFESINSPGAAGPSGSLPEVYLFDADAPQEAISCVSCMPGGRAPARGPEFIQLVSPSQAGVEAVLATRTLTVNAGRPSLVFSSRDALAPGATEGEVNLFEWSHGQVFLITAEPPGQRSKLLSGEGTGERTIYMLGASTDGSDVYFSTLKSLTGEDLDGGRSSIYDARLGGGFAEPTAPSPPCDPTIEGQCQGVSASPPAPLPAQSSGFGGPGNPKLKRCKKGQAKKHGRCVKRHAKKHKKHHKHMKHARKHKVSDKKRNGNRGAGK